MVTNALRLLQAQQHNFREFAPSFAACEAMIAAARSHAEPDDGTLPARFQETIVFDAVRFSHGRRPVFDGVSFAIRAGEIAVLEGESGVGKTTAIDLIIGFHRPAAGRVLVDGVPLTDIAASAWRAGIGYVPQELLLIEGSILDNITMGDDRFDRAMVRRAVELAGLGDFVDSLADGLDAPVGVLGAHTVDLAAPFFAKQERVVLSNNGHADPEKLPEYLMHGGYQGLRKALTMTAEEICQEMLASGLRGRGGAQQEQGERSLTCPHR